MCSTPPAVRSIARPPSCLFDACGQVIAGTASLSVLLLGIRQALQQHKEICPRHSDVWWAKLLRTQQGLSARCSAVALQHGFSCRLPAQPSPPPCVCSRNTPLRRSLVGESHFDVQVLRHVAAFVYPRATEDLMQP